MNPARAHPTEVTFYRLTREDAKIHRCDCGGWVYAAQPCGTCDPQAVPSTPVVIPIRRTGPVHGALYPTAETVHADADDHHDERRTA